MDIRATRLKQAIERSEYTRAEICEKVGISNGALSSYLTGRYFPKQDTLYKLSKVLGVSIGWLMGIDELDDLSKITYSNHPRSSSLGYLADPDVIYPRFYNKEDEDEDGYGDVEDGEDDDDDILPSTLYRDLSQYYRSMNKVERLRRQMRQERLNSRSKNRKFKNYFIAYLQDLDDLEWETIERFTDILIKIKEKI
jgi:toxin-antitoxin system, antitoxin component, xre family